MFAREIDFENALVNLLADKYGWNDGVLNHPTEKDLLDNWAQIIYENNRGIDRLGSWPLTDGEMQQILEQIKTLRTPLRLNEFINGKTVSVKRGKRESMMDGSADRASCPFSASRKASLKKTRLCRMDFPETRYAQGFSHCAMPTF